MNTINQLSSRDSSLVEAVWTLINSMDEEVQDAIGKRLEQNRINRAKSKKRLSYEEALKFVDTLTVKTRKAVPVDEDGKNAVARIKYCNE